MEASLSPPARFQIYNSGLYIAFIVLDLTVIRKKEKEREGRN
jgi:hypothetical protein